MRARVSSSLQQGRAMRRAAEEEGGVGGILVNLEGVAVEGVRIRESEKGEVA